jgi:hypothetical protein
MAMHDETKLPPALAAIADGRDHVRTAELAQVTTYDRQTIRKNVSQTGECFGIRPVKVGKFLLWPVQRIAALLNGEAAK